MTFLVSCDSFWLKLYFVWYKNIATSFLFCLPFAWNIVFQPFTFSLCMSWKVQVVSCVQHMVGFFFSLIHSTTLCILIGECNPFTFKVNIDVRSYYFLLVNSFLFCSSFLPFFLSWYFPWLFLVVVCFDSFLFTVCVVCLILISLYFVYLLQVIYLCLPWSLCKTT